MSSNTSIPTNPSLSTNTTCPPQIQENLNLTGPYCVTGYSANQTSGMRACCGTAPLIRYGKDLCYQYCNISSFADDWKGFLNCYGAQNVKVAHGLAGCFDPNSAASGTRPVSKAGVAILSLVFAGMFGGLLL